MGILRMLFGDGWGFADWLKKNKGGRRYVELGIPDDLDLSDENLQRNLYEWVQNGDTNARDTVKRIIVRRKE